MNARSKSGSSRISALLTGVGLALCLTSMTTNAQAQTRWDLPGGYPSGNYHTQLLHEFAKDVAARTNGKLHITVHDSASLFKASEIKRAVQGNQAQAGEIFLSNFANEDPVFELDAVPFLAVGFDAARKLYQAQKPFLEKKLASQGMMLLYSVPWPSQGIYTNRDLKTVADMKGLKFRSPNPVMMRVAELIGAQPVSIQMAELSQAMATGVIDSYTSSSTTGYDTKTFEYIKKFYDAEASLPKNAVIVNQRAFKALDADTQEALLQAAAKAEADGWQIAQERTSWYMEELRKNGMDIITPSPELAAGLADIGKIMLGDWLKKAGPDGQALIDAYRQQP